MKKLLIFLFLVISSSTFGNSEFSKQKIKLGKTTLTVEVADTDPKRAQGLMFRKNLEPDHGMLFIFPDERPRAFWMKNTLIPLSIAYFDKSKKLIKILDMDPQPDTADFDLTMHSSVSAVQYALEVPKGWFTKKKIKVGDVLELSTK